jgi:type IV secretory pathway TrbD component
MSYEARASAVHKSLLEIKTIGGVEKRLAIANGTIACALTFGTEQPGFLLLSVGVHLFLMWVTKKDPLTIEIYKKYTVLGDVYDPWPKRTMKRNARPEGFGRNTLC